MTQMQSQALVVADVEIFQHADGLWDFGALYRAAGSPAKKNPGEWASRDGHQALAEELKFELMSQNPILGSGVVSDELVVLVVVNGGNSPGVRGHEILAVEYAGWISPSFRIKVNQAFLDRARGVPQISGSQALRIIADQLDAQGVEIGLVRKDLNIFQDLVGKRFDLLETGQSDLDKRQKTIHNNIISINRRLHLNDTEDTARRKSYQKSKQRQGPADLYKWLWDWQEGCCAMCRMSLAQDRTGSDLDAEIDEVVDISKDGWRRYDNTQLLHKKCHKLKKTYQDFRTEAHIHAARKKQQIYDSNNATKREKARKLYEAQNKMWTDEQLDAL